MQHITEIIICIITVASFIYGIHSFFTKGVAMYAQLITCAIGCFALSRITNYLETMFRFPPSSIDKMKVSETFRLRISDEYDYQNQRVSTVSPQDTPVSAWNNGMGWFELMDPETYQVFRVSSLPE